MLGHALVGDLGIVHNTDETQLTETDERVGATWYMPPEAEGGRLDDPAFSFDVYSLGKVIYMMIHGPRVSGAFPFRGEAFDVDRLPVALQRHRAALDELLSRMIVAEPKRRLQSIAEVVALIDDTLTQVSGGHFDTTKCPRCETGTFAEVGALSVLPSGHLRAQSTAVRPQLEVCSNCGHLRLFDPGFAQRQAGKT